MEVHVINDPLEVPPEVQEELTAWQQASADSLALVERLAHESELGEEQ